MLREQLEYTFLYLFILHLFIFVKSVYKHMPELNFNKDRF